MITLHTNYGDIGIELDYENTPVTAKNFMEYVKRGFYENTIFHRVIDNFMIQGGGFTTDMVQKTPLGPIRNEAENAKANHRGTIAMARTNDPHSATAQFFINVVDNDFLNFSNKNQQGWGYCVFGEVVFGMETVDKIKAVPTTSVDGHQDVPIEAIVIQRVTVEDTAEATVA